MPWRSSDLRPSSAGTVLGSEPIGVGGRGRVGEDRRCRLRSAIDPRDEPCQSAVGSSTDPRRTTQIWHRHRTDERGQVHGAAEGTTVARLPDISPQPCGRHRPLGQGCASFARDRDRGSHIRPPGSGWIASPICAHLIFDRHRYERRVRQPSRPSNCGCSARFASTT
jgi:hypothetical protein